MINFWFSWSPCVLLQHVGLHLCAWWRSWAIWATLALSDLYFLCQTNRLEPTICCRDGFMSTTRRWVTVIVWHWQSPQTKQIWIAILARDHHKFPLPRCVLLSVKTYRYEQKLKCSFFVPCWQWFTTAVYNCVVRALWIWARSFWCSPFEVLAL